MKVAYEKPENLQNFQPFPQNSQDKACDDVLKAIEDLRSCLCKKQDAEGFEANISVLDEMVLTTARAMQRKNS